MFVSESEPVCPDEVFGTCERLESLLVLRVKYLFVIVASLIECIDDLVLQDIASEQVTFLGKLSQSSELAKVGKLVPFDIMLSSNDWGTKWAEVLKASTTFDGLLAECRKSVAMPTDPESAGTQVSGEDVASTLQRFKQAVKTQEAVPPGERNNVSFVLHSCILPASHSIYKSS